MNMLWFPVMIIAYMVTVSAAADKDEPATVVCYTCLGVNWDSCKQYNTTCKGHCYKLVDSKHQLFLKGCEEERGKGDTEERTIDSLKLFWANDEPVTGVAHYCRADLCNQSGTLFASFFVVVAALTVVKAII